jgi:F-type H+-transporting ATPase subunit alpha
VADQVVQIYAATNGYLDRIRVDRVGEFLDGLTQRVRAEHEDLLKKIADGDWSDESQQAVDKAVADFADDFGYDLDEEGQPMEEGESDRVARRDGGDGGGRSEGKADESGGEGDSGDSDGKPSGAGEEQEEKETAGAR